MVFREVEVMLVLMEDFLTLCFNIHAGNAGGFLDAMFYHPCR
ncbi:hypothetical protein Hdeb2414_s0009g00300771 [Helianthus debilis subsp. tardiflorus]